MWSASSAGSSPSTRDQLTPAFSNSAPPSSTRATPPPPPGRCQASAPKSFAPSSSASLLQISAWSSWKNFAARSNRSDTRACYHRVERVGSDPPDPCHARLRDHLPQLHVAGVVGAAVADALRDEGALEEDPSPQRTPHVQGLRPPARRLHQARPDPLGDGDLLAARVHRGARGP